LNVFLKRAAVAEFFSGYELKKESTMADYMFLFWNTDMSSGMNRSPEEMQKRMEKWADWFAKLKKEGRLKDNGAPLEPTGKVVRGSDKIVKDGPYAEAKDIVGGYIIITADHIDQAVELSKDCPIFSNPGGSVEVRPVMKMKM
jgi:hypothetical protein